MKRSRLARKGRKYRARFKLAYLSREYVRWIVQEHHCSVPDCWRVDIDPAHTVKRSRGGRWFQIVPLCRMHHDEQEGRTEAFGLDYGIDLHEYATRLALRWQKDHGLAVQGSGMYGPTG